MLKSKDIIPVLDPENFKNILISDKQILDSSVAINDFFIHAYHEDHIQLKLPLPPHKKTVNDFTLILDGSMERSVGVESFELGASSFLYTPNLQITTTQNISTDIKAYYVHFSNHFIPQQHLLSQWNTQSTRNNFVEIPKEHLQILEGLLERINTLYKANEESFCRLIPYYLACFIAEISVYLTKENSRRNNSTFDEFMKLIHSSFKDVKSIKEYASILHISPNHLNKIVKLETGKSASALLNEVCILEAKVLLTQSNLSISEIAYELGFLDSSYFSRYFKKHSHISPSKYREMIDLS